MGLGSLFHRSPRNSLIFRHTLRILRANLETTDFRTNRKEARVYWSRRELLKALAAGSAGLLGVGWAEYEAPAERTNRYLVGLPAITQEDYEARREKARRLLHKHNLDVLYLTGGTSLVYFSGVNWHRSERLFAMLLPRKGDPVFVCPAFEERRARELVGPRFDIRTWEEHESPFKLVAGILGDWGVKTGRVAVEETVRFFEVDRLAKAASQLELVSGDPVTHYCRGIKSEKEMALQRAANQLTLEVYRSAFRRIREGMVEDEVAKLIADEYRKRGVSGGALVLHGRNSAFPHGTRQKQPLREGMVILVDGGCSVRGYRSDMTRTVVFGRPNDRQRRVWDVVKKAQSAALAAARPGVTCGDVDAAARKVIEDAGFGPGYRYFTHRLGHGIGLDGHEWPYLVKDNPLPLQPGMTFSDEPGIYIYGEFGIRLEDIMHITDDGAELYTPQCPSITWPFA